MNRIDFAGRDGGMAFDGEVMAFLQAAHADILNLLYADVPANTPAVISGMVQTTVGTTYSISAGLFYYNGELVKFPAQSVTISSSTPLNITLNTTSENAIFFDNGNFTPYPVIHTREGQLVVGYSGGVDLSPGSFKPVWPLLAAKLKTPFVAIGSVGNTAADIELSLQYAKNTLTNTVHIIGEVYANVAQSLPVGESNVVLVTLPAGFRPAHAVPFMVRNDVRGVLTTIGQLIFYFIRPAAGVISIGGPFNTILSLD
jgi:hypothetical protein